MVVRHTAALLGNNVFRKLLSSANKCMKPKRRPQTNRKQSLDSKWKIGTWVGMTSRSNEHIVIIPDGGLGFAIRARTVRRMSVDQRWNSDATEHINATVKSPLPKIKETAEPAAEEGPVVYADVECDGTQMPADDHISEDKTVRDFNITWQGLQKMGTVITVWSVTQHCMERSVVTRRCAGKD